MMNDTDAHACGGSEFPDGAASDMRGSLGTEIKQSLAYLFQSIRGKYSLETYLGSLGEFTDTEINAAVQSGLVYRGGEAVFQAQPDDESVQITVSLEFQDASGAWKLKKAERAVPKTAFTQETVQRIENAGELRFEIQEPERDDAWKLS